MGSMDLKLIELVRQYPHLYEKKHALYKNKVAIDNAWTAIAGKLNTTSKFQLLSSIKVNTYYTGFFNRRICDREVAKHKKSVCQGKKTDEHHAFGIRLVYGLAVVRRMPVS